MSLSKKNTRPINPKPIPKPRNCEWKQWIEGDTWDTECGNVFAMTEGGLEENKFKFCPHCGGLIVEIKAGQS